MSECFNIYIEDISCNGKGQIENLALLHILKGDTGNGIDKIELTNTSENGLEKTYRITFTDTTTFDYIVKDGNGIVDIEYLSTSLDGLQKTYQVNYQDGTNFQFVVNQGLGIKKIEKTSTLVLVDTYTITFADDSTTTFTVTNARSIIDFQKTSTVGLIDTYTIYFNDETENTIDIHNGLGINDIVLLNTVGLVDTYRISFNNNTHIDYTVTNGAKGDKGDDSFSPYIDPTTKTWWEYNDTTKEYEDTGIAAKSVDVYNITNEIPLGAESFYTLTTAITATPVANRKKGLLLMFESSAGIWETYQFKGVIANWSVLGSWSNDLSVVTKFTNRVLADGGKIHSSKLLEETYLAHKDLLPNTKILLLPEVGVKTRISESNEFINKLYDLSSNNNDAVQATEANQPYLGNIPVGKYNLFGTSKTLAFTSNAFINTAQWSVALVFTQRESTNLLIGGTTTKIQVNGLSQNTITFINESGTSVSMNISNTIGRRNVLILNALGDGNLQVWLNGVSQGSIVNPTNVNFTTLYGATHSRTWLASIFNKALSSTEISNLNTFLTSTFEDIPSVKIGYQSWELHNFDGVVDGVGNVINEVQGATTDGNSELVVNGGFDTDSDWIKFDGWSITNGLLSRDGTPYPSDAYQYNPGLVQLGKVVKITLTNVIVNTGQFRVAYMTGFTPYVTSSGNYTFFIKSYAQDGLYFTNSEGFNGSIDSISIKDVGWDDSTNVYNDVYASTSGTAAVKEQAALKAAAMWCYYNNDINSGAIYGKLYNWYAVKLISLNPPIGWRVPTSADFTQLSSYLGGDLVAGGKMKYSGLSYWASPNTGATNESGFSGLPCGIRNETGVFANLNSYTWYKVADFNVDYRLYTGETLLAVAGSNYIYGMSLRLLKTSPNGEVNTPISSGYFTTNIAAGTANKDITIPFGYEVTSIIIKSDANLTNVAATLYSTAGVSQATLITGKSVTANIPNVFNCLVDQPVQYTNPFVRVNATGNVGMEVIINLQKILL